MKSILIFAAVALCANAAPTDDVTVVVKTVNSGSDEHGNKLYQGDMKLDEYQKAHLNKSTIDKRKAVTEIRYRWPNAIVPYKIGTSAEQYRAAILAAIQQWRDNTCIQFVRHTTVGPHVTFEGTNGCSSAVGYSNKDSGQAIEIGEGCKRTGNVVHEIGHALGFFHEQSRPDRNSSVVVLEENIQAGAAENFQVETNTNNYGVPYDVGSIMHYWPDAFGIEGKNTLVTKRVWNHFRMGQRDGLSFWDIKMANLMYNCSVNCTGVTCVNGGFVAANCSCICPPGFSGETCQDGSEDIPTSWTCGDTILRSPYIIRSPNYPNDYPAETKCIWNIKARRGSRVSAHFKHFELYPEDYYRYRGESREWSQCDVDAFELRSGANIYEGEKYCGNQLQNATKVSATNQMNIVFYARSSWKGFEINITFVPSNV